MERYTSYSVSTELTEAANAIFDKADTGVVIGEVVTALRAVETIIAADRLCRQGKEDLAGEFTPEQIQKASDLRDAIRFGQFGWDFQRLGSVVEVLTRLRDDLRRITYRPVGMSEARSVGRDLCSLAITVDNTCLSSSFLASSLLFGERSRLEAENPGPSRTAVAMEIFGEVGLVFGEDFRSLLQETAPTT